MTNINFTYLYRDGANFKAWSNVIFSNPGRLDSSEVTRSISLALEPDGLFIADRVRIPEIFPFRLHEPSEDDHCYHEFHSAESTAEKPNDLLHRSVCEFLSEVRRACRRGWTAFDIFNQGRLSGKTRSDSF